ncbi:MAG TPA: hypothetical protein VGL35_11340 [Rhizomicrobium sp.]|jgi:hypothetical protein
MSDRTQQCLREAQKAREAAAALDESALKETWLRAAKTWNMLAAEYQKLEKYRVGQG